MAGLMLGLMGSPAWGQSQVIRRLETPRPVPGATPAVVEPSPLPTPVAPLRTPIPSSLVPTVDVLTEWHIQENVCSGHWRPEEMTALFPQLSVAEIELICRETAAAKP